MRPAASLLAIVLLVPAVLPADAVGQTTKTLSDNAQMPAVAVARTDSGKLVGSTAQISVSVATNGTGRVFVDTHPLTGADMQGSARIAARVASSMTGYELDRHDFHFVVRSNSQLISGPSAGSIMAMAATVALENLHRDPGERKWELSDHVLATGTISPDGTIGPVGGILKKAEVAADHGAELFLVPSGQGIYTPREVSNGQVRRGQPVDVAKYCKQKLGIECREVSRLREAVRLSTGFEFAAPEVGSAPSTAEYEQRLAPLADELIQRASLVEDVRKRLDRADLASEERERVVSAVENAEQSKRRADRLVDQGNFYSAASRAFAASIDARFASLLLDFYENDRQRSVAEHAIENASRDVAEARQAAGNATVDGMQSLYTVGAAQARVSDAEQRVSQARDRLNKSEIPQALQLAARSIERSATVQWWLSLDEAFGAGPALPTPMEEIAGDLVDLAREIVAYSTQVRQGQQPTSAVNELRKAQRDHQRGFHAAAALEAAQAQVLATLALELSGTVSDSKVLDSREGAQRAIEQARSRGVQPLLPIAYFEFATVQDTRPAAVQFYRFADTLAGLTGVLAPQEGPTEAEFVGAFEASHGFETTGRSVMIGWFLLGAFATACAAVFVAALRRPDSML